jgi:hypothetical protein
MIAFEIEIDGRKQCTAGTSGSGVTSVVATWVRRPAHDPTSAQPDTGAFEEELTLHVGGLWHDADGARLHVQWLQHALKVGERITIAVVDTEHIDTPLTRTREDPTESERRKRAYYERLKAEYGQAGQP